MKLAYCDYCLESFNLRQWLKQCGCGKTLAMYTDEMNAVYAGNKAIIYAIDNASFAARANERRKGKIRRWKPHNTIYDAWHGKSKIQAWIMREGNPNFETIQKLTKKGIIELSTSLARTPHG